MEAAGRGQRWENDPSLKQSSEVAGSGNPARQGVGYYGSLSASGDHNRDVLPLAEGMRRAEDRPGQQDSQTHTIT